MNPNIVIASLLHGCIPRRGHEPKSRHREERSFVVISDCLKYMFAEARFALSLTPEPLTRGNWRLPRRFAPTHEPPRKFMGKNGQTKIWGKALHEPHA
jgi:hypothetical protein